jgi:archaeal flagellar protein FlaJ
VNFNVIIFGLIVSFWISLALNNFVVFAISSVSLVLVLALQKPAKIDFKKILDRVRKIRLQKLVALDVKRPTLKVFPISEGLPVVLSKPILDTRIFQRLQTILEGTIEGKIRMAGRPANPLNMVKKSISFSLLFLFITFPIAIVLGIFVNPIFFALAAGPIGIAFYPGIALKLAKSKRETEINHELAYFVRFAGIMQSVEKSLYESLIGVIGYGLFDVIETDGKMAYRNVTMFAMDMFEALNEIALHHPNRAFRSFLLSYVATAQTGGDLVNLVEGEADSFFESLKSSIKRYVETSSTFGEILLIILLIMPTFLIATSFLLPGSSVILLVLIGVIGIPMISLGLVIMIDTSQPRYQNKVTVSRLAFLVGIIIGIIGIILQQHPWFIITSGVLGFALVNSFYTIPQFAQIKNLENAMPEFLRDVTEFRKIGYDMTISLFQLFGKRRYNDTFDKLFGTIFSKLKSGQTLSSITLGENRSWMTRLIIFILGKLADTGGGTTLTLEHLTRFVSDVIITKKETVSALRMQMFLVYIGPLLMVWVAKVSTSLLTKMGSNLAFFTTSGIGNTFSITPDFTDAINIVMAISSIAMGFVFTKISMFTLKDTRNVAITSGIVLAAIFLYPYLPSIF